MLIVSGPSQYWVWYTLGGSLNQKFLAILIAWSLWYMEGSALQFHNSVEHKEMKPYAMCDNICNVLHIRWLISLSRASSFVLQPGIKPDKCWVTIFFLSNQ